MSNKRMRALKPDDLERIAGQFRALGEPMRLKILQAVCKSPRMVGDIVTATGGMQANVSKHLALLASAGILARKKEGQRVFYGMKGQLAVKLCELVRTQIAE